jgi:DNA-directed RNA polymerase beta subunit
MDAITTMDADDHQRRGGKSPAQLKELSIRLAGVHMRAASHHIASFNRFITTTMPRTIAEQIVRVPCIDCGQYIMITFNKVQIAMPTVEDDASTSRPLDFHEALSRRLSYSFHVHANAVMDRYTTRDGGKTFTRDKRTTYLQLLLGSLPAMLGSIVCHQKYSIDTPIAHEGTFICNGLMRFLTTQESLLNNHIYVRKMANTYRVELRSAHSHNRSTSTLYINTSTTIRNGLMIGVKVPFVSGEVPLARFLVALADGDHDAVRDGILASIEDPVAVASVADIVDVQLAKATKPLTATIRTAMASPELLPHCVDQSERFDVLCLCMARLLTVMTGHAPPSDIDSYAEKRMLLPGELYEQLFVKSLKQLMRTAQRRVYRCVTNGQFVDLTDAFAPRHITSAFRYAFSTSNFPVGGGTAVGKGVSQLANSSKRLQSSGLQTINKTISRDGVSAGPRQLHPTALGILCSAESPEGRSVGLSNVLACLSFPSSGYKASQVAIVLKATGLVSGCGMTLVRINGKHQGYTNLSRAAFVKRMDELRSALILPLDIAASVVDAEICILCCRGMSVRGVGTAAPGNIPGQSFIARLITSGFRMMTKNEELERPRTFFNISDAMTLFGRSAIQIPFGGHTQSPRLIYAAVQGRQCVEAAPIGDQTHSRVEHKSYELLTPQKRLVQTVGEEINCEFPSGTTMLVVAIMADPYTEEDGIVIKKSTVERGAMMTLFTRTTRESERDGGSFSERIVVPAERGSIHSYAKLDPKTGIVAPHTVVEQGDILIGKEVTYKDGKKMDRSVPMRTTEDQRAVVMSVDVTKGTTPATHHLKNVMVRTGALRYLELGDKLSNSHAQKTSICEIRPDEDMPFCEQSGMIPDAILGSHALPSRMTINLLLEMVAGKHAALSGEIWDATSFEGLGVEAIVAKAGKMMVAHGLPASGKEIMCDGVTGQRLKNPVFIGCVSFYRLKHFIKEKQGCRKGGPTTYLTRQPVSGRSRRGGGRFGSQEQTALVCHGAMATLHDRLLVNSDPYDAWVCSVCKQLSTRVVSSGGVVRCCFCRAETEFVQKKIPFTLKLLSHELATSGLVVRT